jgi:hypothetical protein
MIRRALIAAGTGAKSFDAQLVHHVLMVLGRRPVCRLGLAAPLRRGLLAEKEGGASRQAENNGYRKFGRVHTPLEPNGKLPG